MNKRILRMVRVVLAAFLTAVAASPTFAQLCAQYYGEIHKQDFNTMATAGASNNSSTIPIGWAFVESGTGNNITYAAGDGTLGTANTYSFGTGTNTDRAFGEISSNVFQSVLGACFVNVTGSPITSFAIGYTGEQWRTGGSGVEDKLLFQYSTTATTLITGTYTTVSELDFASPNVTGAAGPRNGNAAGYRSVFPPFTITPSSPIAPGATWFVRWIPLNLPVANDGLAIDDFSLRLPGLKCNLDLDGDGKVEALTDGLMLLRALFGLTGDSVTKGAMATTPGVPGRPSWAEIRQYLNDACGTTFAQ